MSKGRTLRNLSPQQKLAAYKKQVAGAVWMMILLGVLTAAEPFTRFYKGSGVSLGLLVPGTVSGLFGQSVGTTFHIVVAVLWGIILMVLGIMAGFNRIPALIAGVAVLLMDFPLALVGVDFGKIRPESLFPLLITGVIRFMFLRSVVNGIIAVGRSRKLKVKMEEDGRKYEEDLNAENTQNLFGENKQQPPENNEEDNYQGRT